jgi:hypothetical protein
LQLRPLRITEIWAKLAYFTIWFLALSIGGYFVTRAILHVATPFVYGALLNSLMFLVAVRTFRGRLEEVRPTRKWWRATGGFASSLTLGLVSTLVFLIEFLLILGAPGLPQPAALGNHYVLAVQAAFASLLYLNSAYRLSGRSRLASRKSSDWLG